MKFPLPRFLPLPSSLSLVNCPFHTSAVYSIEYTVCAIGNVAQANRRYPVLEVARQRAIHQTCYIEALVRAESLYGMPNYPFPVGITRIDVYMLTTDVVHDSVWFMSRRVPAVCCYILPTVCTLLLLLPLLVNTPGPI